MGAYYYPTKKLVDIAWELGRNEDSSPRQALLSRGFAAHIVDRIFSGKRVSVHTAQSIARGLNMTLGTLFTERELVCDEKVVVAEADLDEETAVTELVSPNHSNQTAPRREFADRFDSIVANWKQYLTAVGCHTVSDVRSADMQNFILMVGREEETAV